MGFWVLVGVGKRRRSCGGAPPWFGYVRGSLGCRFMGRRKRGQNGKRCEG
nr:hypothetical protein Itr_chr07CG02770 [Ipomoea trifida]